uniref:Large ribosomal subunit protein uL4 C-terminal domain-containing protein n=1 Tax=Zooxanthella nutricula TaxID=1333877 RepID=A0A7S2QGF0_9DINO|mmetsp:Transcript_89651/g.274443  ORF Transcript_89651/g.274443 Transcript_89651/m.274443 type:complete len:398 (+) Transcript_89651:104-1297(+)
MATGRPVVSVYNCENPAEKTSTVPMPQALLSPLRPDLVRYIHTNVSKNKRQPISVGAKVGYETAAESWGTGRAVARVPRAPGGGTHRSGQGAFGNMCRGGGMFSPTKTWRRWHRRVNVTQKRHAVVSALAASSLPPLVMARGHRIGQVAELPLVVSDSLESQTKTKQAVEILKKIGCTEELQRVIDSKKVRAGKGKMRNRRYTMRRGPLVVYNEDNGIVRAMRNIPGVETACVTRLNLLKVAPGGTLGRFIIWTEGAFKKMNEMYGTLKSGAPMKKGYHLLRAQMENADIARIINSTEVQSVLRPKLEAPKKFALKQNALKNKSVMARLNPAAADAKAARAAAPAAAKRKAREAASKEHNKKHKRGEDTFYKKLMRAFEAKAADEAKDGEDAEEAEE